MKTVSYKGRNGKETHNLYTVAEADEKQIQYLRNWRDAENVGEWVLTDDQMVVEVLAIGKMRTGTTWLRSATGSFLAAPGSVMDTAPRDNRYTFNGLKVAKQPFRMTKRQRQWITLFAHGRDPVKSYMHVFRGSSREHAERRVFDLMSREDVKMAVRIELKEALTAAGISEDWVLRKMKAFVNDDDMGDNTRAKCLFALAEILEVKPAQKMVAEGPRSLPWAVGEVVAAIEANENSRPQQTQLQAVPIGPDEDGTLEEQGNPEEE